MSGLVSSSGIQNANLSCVLPVLNPDVEGNIADDWQIAMTFLSTFSNTSTAPVRSELRPLASSSQYGMQFVVVNVTAGSPVEWQQVLSIDGGEFGDFGAAGAAPVLYSSRHEWLDLLFTNNASLILSVSLCYASYDMMDLAIHAWVVQTEQNRASPQI